MNETEITDMNDADGFQSLDAGIIRVEQIAGLIFTGVALLGGLIALLILWTYIQFSWLWFAALGVAVLAILTLLWVALFWPAKSFRFAHWRLDDEGLEIRRGVLWRHRISIPLGRVQHADVSQGPLQRQFQIGTLTVHTAGTQNASVELEGLTHLVALKLRDRLVRQGNLNDVV